MKLKIGKREIILTPQRAMSGRLRGWESEIGDPEALPLVLARVDVVHRARCNPPCGCGGEDLLAELAAEDGTPLRVEP